MNQGKCTHMGEEIKQPTELRCEDCMKTEGWWVHLRTCQTCGVTLCCDSSPGKHASAHAHSTGHPVIISAEPGETWIYCFDHNTITTYHS